MADSVIFRMLMPFSLAVVYALMLASTFGDTVPPASSERARQLVRELGDPNFQVRERAGRELQTLGLDAMIALAEVEKSPDPEVRLRARQLLRNLQLGIGPDWPPQLVATIQSLRSLPKEVRLATIHDVVGQYHLQAVPFLVSELTGASQDEQDLAARLIREMQPSDETSRLVLQWLNQLGTAAQRQIRAWALGQSGHVVEGIETLDKLPANDPVRLLLTDEALLNLRAMLKRDPPIQTVKAAETFAALITNDVRFLYLEGIALENAGEKIVAGKLLTKILAMHPGEQEPHFTAALFLEQMEQTVLAEREFSLVLNIPPPDSVYVVNAYLQIGNILSKAYRPLEALDAFQSGLDLYQKIRDSGKAIVFMNGEVAQLEQTIAALRQVAAKADVEGMSVQFEISLKNFDPVKWAAALNAAEAVVRMNVQPHGFRLFDLEEAGLIYDPVKEELMPVLRGQRAGESISFHPIKNPSSVIVDSLDCYYPFEIDTKTGAARKMGRFKRDYRVHVILGSLARMLTDGTATVNGATNDWKLLQEGLPCDFLPEKLEIVLRGRSTNQTWETIRVEEQVQEPMLSLPHAK